MHHTYFDRFANTSGLFQKIPATTKLYTSFALLIAIVTLPLNNIKASIPYFILCISLFAVSNLPWLYLIKRLIVILPFIIIAGIGIIGDILSERFTTLIMKTSAAAIILIVLTSTTAFPELLKALHKIKVPSVFIAILAFLYRFIFILSDERESLQIAIKSRTFCRKIKLAWKTTGWQIGTLFLRSSERADRIYNAMLARGFDGEIHTSTQPSAKTWVIQTSVSIGIIIIIRLIIWLEFKC
ncbi:MAG: hypothetical protein COS89_01250 [Deltaproteobacteria bacterium CG07_land_8_20_14_0_80_38_7]|nr:MAG: hypothetical protein COS89_01250 [Deltaproteobacteria bacterium CG07_land_8_20_14_0_80_38_7]